MRIYISGKITGTLDYMERFQRAESCVKAEHKDADVINPAKVNVMMPSLTHDEYMRMSFCMLDMADAIFMTSGWEDSKGACMEYGYAVARGKEIIKSKAAYINQDFEEAVKDMEEQENKKEDRRKSL